MNPEAIDTLIKQNIPYDEQNPFGEAGRNDVETVPLFVPADDDHFPFGGAAGNVVGFEERTRGASRVTQANQNQNDQIHHSHGDHGHSHGHDSTHHSHFHSHSHSYLPSSSSSLRSSEKPSASRTDSVSSTKSGTSESSVPAAHSSPPPRSSTPTLSGVPTLSHTFSYRDTRNGINGIVKPEPLRRLSSPPAASPSQRPRMRGGIVHSPAGSISGTPARVKSPEFSLQERKIDDHRASDDNNSTSRQPLSPGGSVTSVD